MLGSLETNTNIADKKKLGSNSNHKAYHLKEDKNVINSWQLLVNSRNPNGCFSFSFWNTKYPRDYTYSLPKFLFQIYNFPS